MLINRLLQSITINVDSFLMQSHIILLRVECVILNQSLFEQGSEAETLISVR